MKKLFLLLALMGMVVVGCSKDEVDKGNDNKTEQPNENDGGNDNDIPENIFFELDKESITISPYGGSVDVVVYSNYKWEISGASDWCTPSVKKGDANEDGQIVTFSADVAYDDREATFWFRCANEKIKFVVSQDSTISADEIWYTNGSTTVPTTPYAQNEFGVNIVSNTYNAEKGCWIIKFNGDVTTIGDDAFAYCSSLTSVTIGNSVTTIGDEAFSGCSSLREFNGKYASEDGRCLIIDGTLNSFAPAELTEYTIPDSVTTIGSSAFKNCSSLTSVTIGDSVTAIGIQAFCDCSSLTSVTIGDSVTTIGSSAFLSCSSLTSVTIPDSVTTIGTWAFWGCSSLQEFRGKLASEDNRCLIIDGILNAFAPAGLTKYTIPDNVTMIGDYTFVGCSSLTSVTIGNSVTTIGNSAFSSCNSLTSVTIPVSVTTIGGYAFYSCSNLTSVTIGDSVTTIGERAFDGCSSLTSITIPDSVTTIGYEAFSGCSSLTSVTIGDSVTTIGDSAFCGCSSLTSVTIPVSVTTIGWGAFYGCSSLTSVTIPDRVTTIGDCAFSDCSSLTSVTIGDGVTTIGDCAFWYCSSLTSVTIGDSVTTIGVEAFAYCSSLTSVYCKAITPPAGGSNMFFDNAYGRKIYVSMESVEAYKSASWWRFYADSIVVYNF